MKIVIKNFSELRFEEHFDINYSSENGYNVGGDNKALLYPLLISSEGLLIDGYKRFKHFSDLLKSPIPCIVVENSDSASKCANYRFLTLAGKDNPDIVQKLKLFRFVETSTSSSKIITSWQEKLSLPKAPVVMDSLKQILSWPSYTHMYIHYYRMGHNQLKQFLGDQKEDISIFFRLATDNNLRPVEFLNICTLVKEISLNNALPIADVLSHPSIIDVLGRYQQNRNQLIFHLKSALNELRYPMLTDYQKKFSESFKTLSLSSNINIGYDKLFESGILTVTINISEINDLKKALKELGSNKNQLKLTRIIDMI